MGRALIGPVVRGGLPYGIVRLFQALFDRHTVEFEILADEPSARAWRAGRATPGAR